MIDSDDRTRPPVLRRIALTAFDAAMQEASGEELCFLHGALEKHPQLVRRGDWGSPGIGHTVAGRGAACPLAALALGGVPQEKTDLERAVHVSARHLARHGFRPADFYRAWDNGLIRPATLLRLIDRHLTARALGRRVVPRVGSPSPANDDEAGSSDRE
jgi:hypothetical protein